MLFERNKRRLRCFFKKIEKSKTELIGPTCASFTPTILLRAECRACTYLSSSVSWLLRHLQVTYLIINYRQRLTIQIGSTRMPCSILRETRCLAVLMAESYTRRNCRSRPSSASTSCFSSSREDDLLVLPWRQPNLNKFTKLTTNY